jgi:phosphoglycolate phosphatase-like HAD superfamily hydrolase
MAAEEEDDGDLTAEELLTEITTIDEAIHAARFTGGLAPPEIMERISQLMERRNRLNDRLQRARATEFRAFVDSLNLAALGIRPHFTARRCKVSLEAGDPDPAEMAAAAAAAHARKAELERDIGLLQKKKFLSPGDVARKLRAEAEVRQIEELATTRY